MLRPGEIYYADTDAGRRPLVILSREDLNRGNWVVAVLITSMRFALRSTLKHCVPLHAGEFGMVKDCVVQAETISYIAAADLDQDQGPIGVLDESRLRDVIKAESATSWNRIASRLDRNTPISRVNLQDRRLFRQHAKSSGTLKCSGYLPSAARRQTSSKSASACVADDFRAAC